MHEHESQQQTVKIMNFHQKKKKIALPNLQFLGGIPFLNQKAASMRRENLERE